MGHYEERLEHDIDSIRSRTHGVSELVYKALDTAVHALLKLDKPLASQAGGVEHAGGDVFLSDRDPELQTLRRWADAAREGR